MAYRNEEIYISKRHYYKTERLFLDGVAVDGISIRMIDINVRGVIGLCCCCCIPQKVKKSSKKSTVSC